MGSSTSIASRSRDGFSLIELLMVILIISATLSLVLASLSLAREAGLRTKCASNMRQIGNFQQMYANDYQGWVLRFGQAQWSWMIILKPQEWAELSALELAEQTSCEPLLKCPSHPIDYDTTGFVVNTVVVGPPLPPGTNRYAGATKLTSIRRHSSVIFMTDRAVSGSWADPPDPEWITAREVNLSQARVGAETDLPGVPQLEHLHPTRGAVRRLLGVALAHPRL